MIKKIEKINIWKFLSFIFISLIVIPNFHILIYLFHKPNENWIHIKQYLLKDYIVNSMILIGGTGLLTVFIGVSLAWMISIYDFPLRKFFRWAFVLPLSIPAYIGAYTYNGLLNYTGVIQTFLRNVVGISVNQKYFNIMSMKGAIFIFTMFLFPYVYMMTRPFFEEQSAALVENAKILGRNSFEIFFKVVLPIARSVIVGGLSLVILEVLNDYGVVKYFGIPSFSTAIFQTWFSMGDIDSAIKLSSILMGIVLFILLLEKLLRGKKNFSSTTTKTRPITLVRLTGMKGMLAFLYSMLVFLFSFLIPILQIIYWVILARERIGYIQFKELISSSLWISIVTAILIIFIAVVLANTCRIYNHWSTKVYSKITIAGYSIPGAVIAIGVIVFFIHIDKSLYGFYKIIDPNTKKLVLSTSSILLVFAYIIRFLAIGYHGVEGGFEKIGKKYFEASTTLGMSMTSTFFKVDLPMIKSFILSGFVLVWVDILKELPLTLLLRPFNFNTLATKAFEYANDEMIHEASIPSLIIIMISIVSIYLFHKEEKGV